MTDTRCCNASDPDHHTLDCPTIPFIDRRYCVECASPLRAEGEPCLICDLRKKRGYTDSIGRFVRDPIGYTVELEDAIAALLAVLPASPEMADHPLARGCCALAGERHPGRAALPASPALVHDARCDGQHTDARLGCVPASPEDGLDVVRGWLADPQWPQFGPGIGRGPLDPGRMAARAAVQQVLDVLGDLAALPASPEDGSGDPCWDCIESEPQDDPHRRCDAHKENR